MYERADKNRDKILKEKHDRLVMRSLQEEIHEQLVKQVIKKRNIVIILAP